MRQGRRGSRILRTRCLRKCSDRVVYANVPTGGFRPTRSDPPAAHACVFTYALRPSLWRRRAPRRECQVSNKSVQGLRRLLIQYSS